MDGDVLPKLVLKALSHMKLLQIHASWTGCWLDLRSCCPVCTGRQLGSTWKHFSRQSSMWAAYPIWSLSVYIKHYKSSLCVMSSSMGILPNAKSRDENAKPDCTATVLWRFWSQEFGEPKESNGDHGEGDQAWELASLERGQPETAQVPTHFGRHKGHLIIPLWSFWILMVYILLEFAETYDLLSRDQKTCHNVS